MVIDSEKLFQILNLIAEEDCEDLKKIARLYRIKRIGLQDIDGEFHFTQEVKE